VNQEESEQNEVDGMKVEADLLVRRCIMKGAVRLICN